MFRLLRLQKGVQGLVQKGTQVHSPGQVQVQVQNQVQAQRHYTPYDARIAHAREDVNQLLQNQDRSSYILSKYVPEPVRDGFLAIRGFNLEVNKIHNNTSASNELNQRMGITTADMKFKFWSDLLTRVFSNPMSDANVGEPIAELVRDGIRRNANLDISYFHQVLQTRRHFLNTGGFGTVEDVCSYGEGTYSQLNYAIQALVLSPGVSPSAIRLLEHSPELQAEVSDIAAHIGQATAVTSMILGAIFYAGSRNLITLPEAVLTKHDVSQETLFRLAQGHLDHSDSVEPRKQLQNVVYEVATTANDHMLTARHKLARMREDIGAIVSTTKDEVVRGKYKSWNRGIPDVIYTPFMAGIPTALYLERLERNDFDLFSTGMAKKEWRLGWRSYWGYYRRGI